MKCTNCGNELREGCAFCGTCGTPVTYVQAPIQQAPVQQQLIYQPMPTPQSAGPKKPVGKNRYIFFVAPIQIKLMSIIALALALLCISLSAITSTQVMDTPIDDINAVNIGLKVAKCEQKYKKLMRDFKEAADDINEYEVLDENISSNELNKLRSFGNYISTLCKDTTINNAKETLAAFEEIRISSFSNEDIYYSLDWVNAYEDPIDLGVNIINIVIYGLLALTTIFLIIGFVLRSTGLAVTGGIFAMLYTFLFSTSTIFVLTIVAVLLAVVLLIMANNSYKKYRRTFI